MPSCADPTGDLDLPTEAYRLEVVCFRSGGFRVAVPSHQVQRLLGWGESRPAPAVMPIEALLGLPAEGAEVITEPGAGERSRRQLLIGTGEFCVEVTGPAELGSIPGDDIFGLPALVAASCSLDGLKAIAIDAAGLILIVDLLPALEARRNGLFSA